MKVTASLVIGSDGSTSLDGNSEGVTNLLDRHRFLARRRESDVILIGGNTARNDRYRKTPVPVVVLSRARPELLSQNPKAHWWNISPPAAVDRAKNQFGPAISVEAGVAIIAELLMHGLIDDLELSVTPMTGGENRVNPEELLKYFSSVTREEVDGTIFLSCTDPITSLKSAQHP